MRILLFQHVKYEGPGNISRWVEDRGHQLTIFRVDTTAPLPQEKDFDGLIILGGPMNVYQEAEYPWLVEEKTFIRNFLQTEKPILGICLGSQLLADILDGRVMSGKTREIGFFPVQKVRSAAGSAAMQGLPKQFTALHWHGDTFSIPLPAARIMASEGTANQAFEYRKNVLALQFHIETDWESLQALLRSNTDDWMQKGRYVQNRETMETIFAKEHERLKKYLYTVMDALFEGRKAKPSQKTVTIRRRS